MAKIDIARYIFSPTGRKVHFRLPYLVHVRLENMPANVRIVHTWQAEIRVITQPKWQRTRSKVLDRGIDPQPFAKQPVGDVQVEVCRPVCECGRQVLLEV